MPTLGKLIGLSLFFLGLAILLWMMTEAGQTELKLRQEIGGATLLTMLIKEGWLSMMVMMGGMFMYLSSVVCEANNHRS
jgi:hypothetical protein